jgi:hypothetical protein
MKALVLLLLAGCAAPNASSNPNANPSPNPNPNPNPNPPARAEADAGAAAGDVAATSKRLKSDLEPRIAKCPAVLEREAKGMASASFELLVGDGGRVQSVTAKDAVAVAAVSIDCLKERLRASTLAHAKAGEQLTVQICVHGQNAYDGAWISVGACDPGY